MGSFRGLGGTRGTPHGISAPRHRPPHPHHILPVWAIPASSMETSIPHRFVKGRKLKERKLHSKRINYVTHSCARG